MTNPANGDDAARVEQMPCPNPWCRKSKPALFRGGFLGRICRVQCETCAFSGPERQEDDGAAILAWNTRAAIAAMPTPAATPDLAAENARLRAELQAVVHNYAIEPTVWQNDIERIKNTLGGKSEIIAQLTAKDAENARLRDERDVAQKLGKQRFNDFSHAIQERNEAYAENAQLRAEGVLAYQHGYDHGADKFRSALKVERQIVKAKDAEIAALRETQEQLIEANKCLRNGYADVVSGFEYILQHHGRLNGVGFDRVQDHFAQWVTIPEREDLLAGSHKLPAALDRAKVAK